MSYMGIFSLDQGRFYLREKKSHPCQHDGMTWEPMWNGSEWGIYVFHEEDRNALLSTDRRSGGVHSAGESHRSIGSRQVRRMVQSTREASHTGCDRVGPFVYG